MYIPNFDDVEAAHKRIQPYVHLTPVLTSSYFNQLTGAELFFKCENFQKAGAFKVRGACNAVFGLDEQTAQKGVATHSSGNHALSLSVRRRPAWHTCHCRHAKNGPAGKKRCRQGLRLNNDKCEPSTSSREATFAEVVAQTAQSLYTPTTIHGSSPGKPPVPKNY